MFESPTAALKKHAESFGPQLFLNQPLGKGQNKTYSYREVWQQVQQVAQGFRTLGLQPGARVGLLSKNCAEWFICDWAIQLAGLVSVPLFATSSMTKLRQALVDIPVDLLIVGKLDNADQYQPLMKDHKLTATLPYGLLKGDVDWQWFMQQSALPEHEHSHAAADELMTIHSTSGSGGKAKGVELTYGAYFYACQNAITSMQVSTEDRLFSYLPIAHIAERMMIQGNAVFAGAKVYFVHSLNSFAKDLKYAKPTAFMSVPRLWKKFQTEMHKKIPANLLSALLDVPLLNRVIKKAIRWQLGLSHARLTGSGAAPMPLALLRWYERIGIPISEAWGMTETCGLSTMNYPYDAARAGTIGQAVKGTELKVDEQGELLIRSQGVFERYTNEPELTQSAFTDEGFFRTGDVGLWDSDIKGWRLQGRMSESFKSSKGKFIYPAEIEAGLLHSPLIEQACVLNDDEGNPIAAVQLAEDVSFNSSVRDELIKVLLQNNRIVEAHERLSSMLVSHVNWSTENDLLTPTMKPKRKSVQQFFANAGEGLIERIGVSA